MDALELVEAFLPGSVAFYAHLDAAEDDFLAAFEVDAELDNVAVIHGVGSAFCPGCAETDVIEEGAGTALNVPDVPLVVAAPELAMPARDDFALEADWLHIIRVLLSRRSLVVSLGVSANSNYCILSWQVTADDRESQRWP